MQSLGPSVTARGCKPAFLAPETRIVKPLASIFILVSILILSVVGAQAVTPTPDDAHMPYSIHAPWPAGLTWIAGELGYYYDEGTHRNADRWALDFNARDRSDGGVLVLAAADGVVRQATCKDTGGYGCTVVIGHAGDGTYCYQSRYAHLREELLVSVGEWVAQGEPLGRVDSTGKSTGDHLHFAVYRRSGDECSPSAAYRNDADMAVVPEPMVGVSPISEGADLTSANYPVGYPRLTQEQIQVPGTPLPQRHQAILDTYERFGGQYFVFGSSQGPVGALDAGHNIYYQEFGPHTYLDQVPWHGLPSTIVEQEGKAYLMVGPIWQHYVVRTDAAERYGAPVSDSYQWYRTSPLGDIETGFRNDFRKLSLVWDGNQDHEVEELDAQNSEWRATLWDQPNTFDGPAYYRPDRYLDFYWPKSSIPGPFIALGGFSALWETSAGGLISAYTLKVEMQGHLRILVKDEEVLREDSPDSVWSGSSGVQLGFGPERVQVFYWQDGGRPGRIKVAVESAIIPSAFASEGEITASSVTPTQVDYANFPPPRWEVETLTQVIHDSAVTATSGFLTLEPGEQSQLVFDIQNTGNVTWLPGQSYALINTNDESLGASPVQTLIGEIPPGNIAQWVIPITAPSRISLNWTEWQMAYDGEPFGDTASSLVAVVPEGEINIDIGALLVQWLEGLKQDIEDRFDQFLQDLADRFEEWLQRESERLLSELLESLSQQCCGAVVVAPAALLLVGWTSARRRRKRSGDRDRD